MSYLQELKKGITTGACAAAAAQAAVTMLFHGNKIRAVQVKNLSDQEIAVSIEDVCEHGDQTVTAAVIKDGGDDPDVTNGLTILVTARKISQGIVLKGGQGVGKVTKPGLQVEVGEPAINPVPRKMIEKSVLQVLPTACGVELTVSVPEGEKVCTKTLNPKLGIIGGISILGTTGIVEPMSEEAFKKSLVPQIQIALKSGYSYICLTPGRIGEKILVQQMGIPSDAVVQMSNFVGYMLGACVDLGIKGVILAGHHSKISKIAAGCFHTHSRVADARMEVVAAYAGAEGASPSMIRDILAANTSEEALQILIDHQLEKVMNVIAVRASERASEYVYGELEIGTAMFDLQGNVVAIDTPALEIGRKMNWRIQL